MDSNASVTVSQPVGFGCRGADPLKCAAGLHLERDPARPQLGVLVEGLQAVVPAAESLSAETAEEGRDGAFPNGAARSGDAVVRLSQNDGLAGRSSGWAD